MAKQIGEKISDVQKALSDLKKSVTGRTDMSYAEARKALSKSMQKLPKVYEG